eukprot:364869-Chlamydomonas_euryale.AAC.1
MPPRQVWREFARVEAPTQLPHLPTQLLHLTPRSQWSSVDSESSYSQWTAKYTVQGFKQALYSSIAADSPVSAAFKRTLFYTNAVPSNPGGAPPPSLVNADGASLDLRQGANHTLGASFVRRGALAVHATRGDVRTDPPPADLPALPSFAHTDTQILPCHTIPPHFFINRKQQSGNRLWVESSLRWKPRSGWAWPCCVLVLNP